MWPNFSQVPPGWPRTKKSTPTQPSFTFPRRYSPQNRPKGTTTPKPSPCHESNFTITIRITIIFISTMDTFHRHKMRPTLVPYYDEMVTTIPPPKKPMTIWLSRNFNFLKYKYIQQIGQLSNFLYSIFINSMHQISDISELIAQVNTKFLFIFLHFST